MSFAIGFEKKANTSSIFRGTAKMLAAEGEKALGAAESAAKKIGKGAESSGKSIDYRSFNPPRLYNYKANAPRP